MHIIIAILLAAVIASAVTNKIFGSGHVEYVIVEPIPWKRRFKQAGALVVAVVLLHTWVVVR